MAEPPDHHEYRRYVYLDTETTGLFGDVRIVDVAIVDDAGDVLIDTLVNPGIAIPAQTSRIHGIYDDDVAGKPTLREIMPRIDDAIRGRSVVIYNAAYDRRLFPGQLDVALSVHCALRRFKQLPIAVGSGNGTLAKAAAWARHEWTGQQHRALADALAARSVWQRLETHP
jgi:DNA polymerase III epsilon subunit-like protein